MPPLFSTSATSTLNRLQQLQSLNSISTRRLATGQQIPRAGLDPAGQAIAEALRVELDSQTQALRNTNDGLSLLQTAEGGLGNIQEQLGRLQELGVAASSTFISADQRAALNLESNQILQEINRVAATTQFNGQNLLNGALAAGTQVQVGTDGTPSDVVTLQIADSRAAALGISTTDNLATASSSQAFLDQVQQATQGVSARRATIGAAQNTLSSAAENLGQARVSAADARSRIADVDVASEVATLVKLQILQRSSLAVLAQTANLAKSSIQLAQ